MTDSAAHSPLPMDLRPPVRQAFGVEIPIVGICDVGAMVEGVERFAGLVSQELANVNAFEPLPPQFDKLVSLAKPRTRYFPVVLGDGGRATFHVTHYPGCSSLYEPDPAVIDLFNYMGTVPGANFTVIHKQPVQTVRMDDVPGLPELDYLKLDVQGAELDVLKGASKALRSALVIESEVEFLPIYKNQPLFGEVQVFLRQHGFVLHKFLDIGGRTLRPFNGHGGNPFAAMSQVLWADAIFVRDFTRLERFTDEQLLKCAAILYQAYNSHDLVHYLLAEHDRRRGTGTAQCYASTVMSQSSLKVEYLTQKIGP